MSYCIYCMAHMNNDEASCHKCGKSQKYDAPLHQLAPGTILNGRYYVGSALGEGGFGITYIGRDLKLDMKVAIKEYFPTGFVTRSNTASATVSCGMQGDRKEFFEQGRDRFLREARTLARFSGTDGIVDIRDFFEENNTAYIVMEYLDGETLKEKLVKNGVMTADAVITTLMPVFKALKKVHEKDLIHRDISPDNIMIVEDKIKLLDFGSARNVTAAANKSLSVLLKPGYAPEEQYRSKGVQGPWTDIYALCATIYKCITGRTPEDSTDRLFEDSLKKPSEYGAAIDRETEAVIMKGLAVRAADRYQNIDELLSALENRKTIPLAAEEIKTEKIEETEEEKTVGVWGETQASQENAVVCGIEDAEETVGIWGEKQTSQENIIACEIADSEETIGIWGDEKTAPTEALEKSQTDETATPQETVETEKTESIWSQPEEETETAVKPKKGKKKMITSIITVVVCVVIVVVGIVTSKLEDFISSNKELNNDTNDYYDETPDVPEEDLDDETPDVPEDNAGASDVSNNTDNSFTEGNKTDNSGTETTTAVTTTTTVTTEAYKKFDIDDYIAPVSLGNDIRTGIIQIAGDLYNLPVPIQCFFDNGWELSDYSSDVSYVEPRCISGVILEKDGYSINLGIETYYDYSTYYKDCIVTELYAWDSSGADIVLPGGITFGMTKDAVIKKLPSCFSSGENSGGFYINNNGCEQCHIRINLDQSYNESGTLRYIRLHTSEWDY